MSSMSNQNLRLCEFHCVFGADAHQFLFTQLDSNENALANLNGNLSNTFSDGQARANSRIYNEGDLVGLQKSCLNILKCFKRTNDVVGCYVVTENINVDLRRSDMLTDDEYEWFETVFSCAKYPEWGRLVGK